MQIAKQIPFGDERNLYAHLNIIADDRIIQNICILK